MRNRLTVGASFALFCSGVVVAVAGGTFNQWKESFDVGAGLSYFFSFLMAGILLGVWISSRIKNRHPWFSVLLFVQALGWIVAASSQSFNGVIFSALMLGIGVGCSNFNANSLTIDLWKKGGPRVLSLVNSAFGLGAVLTPLFLIDLPWRTVFAGFSLISVAAGVLVLRAPPMESSAGDARKLDWTLAVMLGAIFLYVALEGITASFAGQFIQHQGFSESVGNASLSIFWAAALVGRVWMSGLIGNIPYRLFLNLLLGTILVLAIGILPKTAWAVAGVGLLYGPMFPLLLTVLQRRFGNRSIAYIFYVAGVGGTIVPGLFALIPISSFPLVTILIATVLLLTALKMRSFDAESYSV